MSLYHLTRDAGADTTALPGALPALNAAHAGVSGGAGAGCVRIKAAAACANGLEFERRALDDVEKDCLSIVSGG